MQKYSDAQRRATNKYRHILTENQKVIGISDSNLASFSNRKLIQIIRKLEKNDKGECQ